MSGAAAESAGRRFTRTALSMACVLVGLAAVALVAGRGAALRDGVSANLTGAPRAGAGPVAAGAGVAVNAAAPVTAPRAGSPPPAGARRDEGSTLERRDTTSIDTGDWRDGVAAVLGRKAVANAPLDAGAMHTHLAPAEGTLPQALAPAALPDLAAAPGGPELPGFDGGDFWFGPHGLVRMREAQR